ncbi:unnamed protein product [Staurois parvus]|uniref:Uncharacterized protein n=1 Tax=Staurois parvus TaxID=386267 RepID=A0ABN9EZ70_9NEOB|nr:unnamed protein product [Staurois parvus]
MSARSCDQLCPITADHTDHQGTDDQCALMISVAPEVPPISASQCRLSVPPNNSASQCCLTVPYISVMYQCCLSVPISDACQCPSVPPISAYHCNLISAHQ